MPSTHPHILTDNERFGDRLAPPSSGGAWIVLVTPPGEQTMVGFVATNRHAAEAAVRAKQAASGYADDHFAIQVWEPQDVYDPRDDA